MSTIVHYAGYDLEIYYNGAFYEAQDRRGRIKIRRAPGLWCCVKETTDEAGNVRIVHQQITEQDLLDVLEAGARKEQRNLTPKGPRPPLISGGEFYTAPRIERVKGRVSNRESRGKGRVE